MASCASSACSASPSAPSSSRSSMRNWLLPEYIDDILPPEAERIEALRRVLLDHFRGHGYRLGQPPLVEHLGSLFTGTGPDLDLPPFEGIDPASGRVGEGHGEIA